MLAASVLRVPFSISSSMLLRNQRQGYSYGDYYNHRLNGLVPKVQANAQA